MYPYIWELTERKRFFNLKRCLQETKVFAKVLWAVFVGISYLFTSWPLNKYVLCSMNVIWTYYIRNVLLFAYWFTDTVNLDIILISYFAPVYSREVGLFAVRVLLSPSLFRPLPQHRCQQVIMADSLSVLLVRLWIVCYHFMFPYFIRAFQLFQYL